MPETWKGKTRGGTFGYMFFIYMIRCLGITAAYGFLSLVVLYFIPFAPKATASTWQYARNRLKYGRAKAAGKYTEAPRGSEDASLFYFRIFPRHQHNDIDQHTNQICI